MPKLTQGRVNDAKAGTKESFLWCSANPGFGLRIYPPSEKHPNGRKVFVAQVRFGKRQWRVPIGPASSFTLAQAKGRFDEIIRELKAGRDPSAELKSARDAVTVAEMCAQYLEAAEAGLVIKRNKQAKRASTVAIDRGRIQQHIVPVIGSMRAMDVQQKHVQKLVDDVTRGKTRKRVKTGARGVAVVTGGAGTAARVAGLLGGIFTWAKKRGIVSGDNPVRGIETAAGEARERTLTPAEYAALGKALDAAQAAQEQHARAAAEAKARGERPPRPPTGLIAPGAIAALRLIALTGLRKEEACGLRWNEVDLEGRCLRLSESKTGRSRRVLGREAIDLLAGLPKLSEEWVFPGRDGKASADYKKAFVAIFAAAGLTDVRAHDLRRSFATVGAGEELSTGTIGELLGHAQRGVTEQSYIPRRPDAALVAAADMVSGRVAVMLAGGADVVPMVKKGGQGGR